LIFHFYLFDFTYHAISSKYIHTTKQKLYGFRIAIDASFSEKHIGYKVKQNQTNKSLSIHRISSSFLAFNNV